MFVQNHEQFGIQQNQFVNVLLDFMVLIVNNVYLQDHGIKNKMLVYVLLQELYGIHKTKLAIVHMDYMDLYVLLVQPHENGKIH